MLPQTNMKIYNCHKMKTYIFFIKNKIMKVYFGNNIVQIKQKLLSYLKQLIMFQQTIIKIKLLKDKTHIFLIYKKKVYFENIIVQIYQKIVYNSY